MRSSASEVSKLYTSVGIRDLPDTLTVAVFVVLLLLCDMPAGELGLMAPVKELAGDLDAELLPRWCLGE